MIHTNSHPNLFYVSPSSQNNPSHPPPKDKIINSKDEAIQQLIYENTFLKKKLSELMLKTSPNQSFQTPASMQSNTNTMAPSLGAFTSCRNSLENSTNFVPGCRKDNFVPAQNICSAIQNNHH